MDGRWAGPPVSEKNAEGPRRPRAADSAGGTFRPAERQSEMRDAAARALAVASRCLTESYGWWEGGKKKSPLNCSVLLQVVWMEAKLIWEDSRLWAFKKDFGRLAFWQTRTKRLQNRIYFNGQTLKVHYVGQKRQSKCLILQNHIDFFFFFPAGWHCFSRQTYFFYLSFVWLAFPLTLRGETWNKNILLLIFFTVPVCSPQRKNASTILLSIFIKISLKGRAVSDSFLGHHEQHSSQEVSSTWRRSKKKRKKRRRLLRNGVL